MSKRAIISRLGHRGDGIADSGNGLLFIAGALPGEEVEIEQTEPDRATLTRVVTPSAARLAPPCRHYGACGGCIAQHMDETLYREWKVESVRAAFAQHGLTPEVDGLVPVQPGSRRRVTLAMARQKGRIVFGFHAAQSHEVVEITDCMVASAAINSTFPSLRELLCPIVPQRGELTISVLETAQGLDVAVSGASLSRNDFSRLSSSAAGGTLARLTIDGEGITFRNPQLTCGGLSRHQPAGGFAQAVATVEDHIASFAVRALDGCRRIVELFCGSGALTLRLARYAAIHAVEGDAAALAALDASLRQLSGLKPVKLERRDLFRRPLRPDELKGFDAALIDPPRQGAQAQMPALAASALKRIVYVSCAPSTLARDAKVLVDAGYRLHQVTPFDQFLWTRHVEVVAVFERR